jgi:hypothetical protein
MSLFKNSRSKDEKNAVRNENPVLTAEDIIRKVRDLEVKSKKITKTINKIQRPPTRNLFRYCRPTKSVRLIAKAIDKTWKCIGARLHGWV